jgi:RimJ/RimL family protein N-acetyltransferase
VEFAISRLAENNICEEYLKTLNDPSYMRYSLNKDKEFTFESQVEYLHTFDFKSNYLLAIANRQNGDLVATATLRLIPDGTMVNIGFLVLKHFGGMGLGKKALRALSAWVFELYPLVCQQIGTRRENIAMRRIALAAGFHEDDKIQSSEYVYFFKQEIPLPQILEIGKSDFHIICNDAGGALQISALANQLFPDATATLSGPAVSIFESYSTTISNLEITSDLIASKKIIFGSGFYGGLESKLLESELLSKNYKIVLLDHWVNYKERFNQEVLTLPNAFLTTNRRAAELANEIFPHTLVQQIPDFLFAAQKQKYLSEEPSLDSVLLILEPDALIGEGINYPIGRIEQYLPIVVNFCRAHGVANIILRKHPSQIFDLSLDFDETFSDLEIGYSSNESLVGDLLRSRAVFGFHSSALYASAMLGIETYSFFAGFNSHWTNHFPAILATN